MVLGQGEIRTASLSQLGVILMSSVDRALQDGEYEDIDEAYQRIGQEIIRRIPEPTKIRHLMDFHYEKWANLQAKGTNGSRTEESNLMNAFYEFRAMMAGFVEAAPKKPFDVGY